MHASGDDTTGSGPRAPVSSGEWEAYFAARWAWLRQPWREPAGSERDELESGAVHRALFGAAGEVLAIGRLHSLGQNLGQVRYVATAPGQHRRGHGRIIMKALEEAAQEAGMQRLLLNAREEAVAFYEHLGYKTSGPAPTLFGTIRQVRMEKMLLGNDATRFS